MAIRRYKPEEIVTKLRQVDVLHSQEMSMADAIRQIGVSEVSYYRWRKEYGGITYIDEKGETEFLGQLDQWSIGIQVDEAMFEAGVAEGAKKVSASK